MAVFHLTAHGHEHVQATHQSTAELTSDEWLTPAGDCIVGVSVDSTPSEFPDELRTDLQDPTMTVELEIAAAGTIDRIIGRGDQGITATNDRSMVARTSTYTDDRTILVDGNAAAADLDRTLINHLQSGATLEARLRTGADAINSG